MPIGIVALAVIATAFCARQVTERPRIDYLGAVVLGGALSAIVLFTSLGGTTYAWGSTPMLGLITAGVVLLALFPFVEARAPEPILPLELFRNRVFTVTTGVGLVIGVALFGAVTFVPLYLQVVKGHSPTESGLLLTPMMGGLLVASIVSGNLISRYGRYRPFPIAGTAIASIGLFLLSTLEVGTSTWFAAAYMAILGVGIGQVIQVLVLAVQNAVDYRLLGVATSASTMSRQIGGSIGVSAFGAIFANRLGHELAERLPSGIRIPTAATPAVVKQLPPAIRVPYVDAFAASLRPVFLVAAVIALAAFALAWLLPELPLRQTAAAAGIGESFASPRDDSSERELERIVSKIVRGDTRARIYNAMSGRAGLDLTPAETWLLGRLRDRTPATVPELARELAVSAERVTTLAAELAQRGLLSDGRGAIDLTAEGRQALTRLVEAGRAELTQLVEHWRGPDDKELDDVLRRVAASLVAEVPEEPFANV